MIFVVSTDSRPFDVEVPEGTVRSRRGVVRLVPGAGTVVTPDELMAIRRSGVRHYTLPLPASDPMRPTPRETPLVAPAPVAVEPEPPIATEPPESPNPEDAPGTDDKPAKSARGGRRRKS